LRQVNYFKLIVRITNFKQQIKQTSLKRIYKIDEEKTTRRRLSVHQLPPLLSPLHSVLISWTTRAKTSGLAPCSISLTQVASISGSMPVCSSSEISRITLKASLRSAMLLDLLSGLLILTRFCKNSAFVFSDSGTEANLRLSDFKPHLFLRVCAQ